MPNHSDMIVPPSSVHAFLPKFTTCCCQRCADAHRRLAAQAHRKIGELSWATYLIPRSRCVRLQRHTKLTPFPVMDALSSKLRTSSRGSVAAVIGGAALSLWALRTLWVKVGPRRPSYDPASSAVLVTGCSSGIGRASCLHLARAGYLVIAVVRRERDVEALVAVADAEHVTANVHPVVFDVESDDGVASARTVVAALLKGSSKNLAAVVTCAGVSDIRALELTKP